MAVERQPAFEAERVARSQATGDGAKLFTGIEDRVPDAGAGGLIGRDVDFESIFGGVAGAAHEDILQATQRSARHPVELHYAQVGVGKFLEKVDRSEEHTS